MATRQGTLTYNADGSGDAVWTGFAVSADVGTPVAFPANMGEFSAQAVGTFTGALGISLTGSNDGATFAVMDDVGGTPVVITASTKIWRISNIPKYIKPLATAGAGAAAADVYVHAMKR